MSVLSPLPIDSIRDELHRQLLQHRSFILSAPTGSGKSTRIARFLLDDGLLGDGQVLILQPRRLPARMLARRVAGELGESVGERAGYHIRFDEKAGPRTRILFVTEGLLLRRLLSDPELKGVSAILFDEFHERHLDGDIGLALARRLQQTKRPDLLLGVMSATLDLEVVRRFLPEAVVLETEGRTYPVEVRYLNAGDAQPWDAAAKALREAVRSVCQGDVLIFMPGAYEIRRTLETIEGMPEAKGRALHALHGELPPEAQDAAVQPSREPKIIVATNVAETSLTIDGVRVVIDAGLARVPAYDPHRGINTLLVEKISCASADQRAGRAGRTAPGVCYRLWSEREHVYRIAQTPPEISRLELSETLLALKVFGVKEPQMFTWVEPPPPLHVERGLTLLRDLSALGADDELTPLGRSMAAFPLHPRYSRILLAASEYSCLEAVALAVALSEVRDILLVLNSRQKSDQRDDLLMDDASAKSDLLVAMRAWQWAAAKDFDYGFCQEWGIHRVAALEAGRVMRQLLQTAQSQKLNFGDSRKAEGEDIRRCLLLGFSDQLAMRLDRASLRCALVHRRKGEIRRQSVVQQDSLLVSAEIEERELRGEVVVLLGKNTAVEMDWLREFYPGDFMQVVENEYNASTRRVESRKVVRFRDLVLSEQADGIPDTDAAAAILAQRVMSGELLLKQWDESVENWIRRVNCLARHCPELEIEPINAEDRQLIIEQICHGAVGYKEIKDRAVLPYVQDWVAPAMLPLVDEWVPERFALPGGSRIKLRYEADGSVVLPAILQQLYDVPGKSLAICNGKLPLKIEILAPSRRPVQITGDLDGFWATSYPAVKKDLRGRYPKHEWR